MIFLNSLLIIFSHVAVQINSETDYCNQQSNICSNADNLHEDIHNLKLMFYDVNPVEGFNLRRDVYMRFAIWLAESSSFGKMRNWQLVLPPWYNLYHWKSDVSKRTPRPWSMFFDIESLKSYAPVVELHEIFTKSIPGNFQIDILYVLQNYEDPFEDGVFRDKWEINNHNCYYDGLFWGYNNVTAEEVVCVKFQGRISMLKELIALHPKQKKVMFSHGEIPLHDSYGTKSYWECRKSMKFNKELVKIATEYISKNFDCNTDKCNNYFSVHWRRQDFARSRGKDVPSITGTAKQIDKMVKKHKPKIKKIFISSDGSQNELELLENELIQLNYKVYFYFPSNDHLDRFRDGGIAIIDQIICAHSAYFIGTHESTFSYRIQEEREILGFDSSTTFNRLCPDSGHCEKPSKWTIVH